MANIDLGNLTRYDGKIKEYAEGKYLSKNTANWQMTEKAGAVTCYPVPNTELEPIVNFMFTETPPLNGDKGPDNPSVITDVSGMNIARCGKNLCPNEIISTIGGTVEITNNSDGSLTFNGSPTNNYYAYVYNLRSPNTKMWAPWLKKGGTYTFSMSGDNGGVYFEMYHTKDTGVFGTYNICIGPGESVTYTLPTDRTGLILRYRINANTTVSNCTVKVQIEEGSTATTFEPYSGNDYTISFNNVYYGGKVNLATGLMTVTHWGHVFDGTESASNFDTLTNNGRCIFFSNILQAKNSTNQTCTHLPLLTNFTSDTTHFYVNYGSKNTGLVMFTPYLTLSDFKSWLAEQYASGTPVTVACELKTPYTVQLTPMQIKSLFALDKNTPRLNTLYTDADSIQVGYQKHPARTSYELENAILALGGGE